MHSSYALVSLGVGVAIALNPLQSASAVEAIEVSVATQALSLEKATDFSVEFRPRAKGDKNSQVEPSVQSPQIAQSPAAPASQLPPAGDPTQVPLQPGNQGTPATPEIEGQPATEQPLTPATPEPDNQPDAAQPVTPAPAVNGTQPQPETTPTPAANREPTVLDILNPSPNPLSFPTRPEEVRVRLNQPITLQEALELAQRNNRPLQAAIQELERNRQAVREAQATLLPSVDANVNLTNSGQDQLVRETIFSPATTEFQTTTTLGASLGVNYTLFSSGRRLATIIATEGQERFQELQVEVLAEQLRLDVSTEYYDMQQRDEEVRIARDALQQAEQSLRDAEALERAGVGTRFDVLQAQVDVANSRQELTQALSQQQIARRRLAERLGIAEDANISAADEVEVAADWTLSLEDSIVLAYRNRAELEQQLVQREIAQARRRAALADLGPQVSVFAQLNLNNILDEDAGFRESYQVGARVNLNLFDGGAARARARQQEINVAIAETQFADVRENVRFQVEQAFLSLQANRENIQTTALGVDQAREALRLARLRFQAGVGTQSDVLRAQTELTRAEVNQLNAILGYNRSLVSLQRAISNLPTGNLADAP